MNGGTETNPAVSDERTQIPLPLRPAAAPDTVTRDLNRLVETPVRRSIIHQYRLTRVPGSPVFDGNGDEA